MKEEKKWAWKRKRMKEKNFKKERKENLELNEEREKMRA